MSERNSSDQVYTLSVPSNGDSNAEMSTLALSPAWGNGPANNIGISTVRMEPMPSAAGAPDDGKPAFDPYRLLHRALRGRYRLVILLAMFCGLLGAFGGWSVGEPVYRSEGLIQLAYSLPQVWQETDQTRPLQMYDAFMSSQQLVISSRRMVEKALQEPTWHDTGRGATPEVVKGFAKSLLVEFKPKTQHMKIMYADGDAAVAAAAVRSIISAYSGEYTHQEQMFQQQRLHVLQAKRDELAKLLGEQEAAMKAASTQFGAGGVASDRVYDRVHEAMVSQANVLSSMLTQIRVARATAPIEQEAPKPNEPPKPAPKIEDFTAQQIALVDPGMRGLLSERSAQEERLDELLTMYGPQHPEVLKQRRALARANDRIDRYARDYREYQAAVSTHRDNRLPGGPLVVPDKSEATLKVQEERLAKLYDQAKADLVSLGAQRLQGESLRLQADKVRQELADVTRRINVLDLESTFGRLNVISNGEVPLTPFKNDRIRMGLVMGTVGGFLPIAIFVAFGLLNRRYRFSDETESDISQEAPLLGVLPSLTDAMVDCQGGADAAQCVHQIRVMLQVAHNNGNANGRAPVHLITSSCAGEGKTSLAVGLGLSFMASGARTLIIDCDLVGQRLTRGFGAGDHPGLQEALAGGRLGGCVQRINGDLFLLSVGRANALDACSVSPRAIRRLIEMARREFDTVLIDSGPILGSVEASVLAAEVDGVILIVSRGQQSPLVERALRQLRSVNAKLAGFVFNRAERTDFYRSVHPSSANARSSPAAGNTGLALARPRTSATAFDWFGPVARSVASHMRDRERDYHEESAEAVAVG